MTHLFYQDAYKREAQNSRVTAIDEELHGVVVDDSLFFAEGGGQPGDIGTIAYAGETRNVIATIKSPHQENLCCLLLEKKSKKNQSLPIIGTPILQRINWTFRYTVMQMHSALHLLCASLPFGVTGGRISPQKSRLDFDTVGHPMPDKIEIAESINHFIKRDLPITPIYMDWDFLTQNPHIVRTLKVQPPKISDQLRMIRIGEPDSPIDLQPCGGTHVRRTSEIPEIVVTKIENKGQQNKRVSLTFVT